MQRSKSEFDVSKLQELLAQDEADSTGCTPGEASGRKVSAEWRPLSGEEERGESVAARRPISTTTSAAAALSLPPQLPSPGDGESGEGEINRAPDRQDEPQRFFLSRANAAAADSTPVPPPSSSPPTPPSQSLPSGTQPSSAPVIYTARPIYINLSRSSVHSGPTPEERTRPGSGNSTPVARSITVISRGQHLPAPAGQLSSTPGGQHLLTPAAMSEESSDKTPTNPTGGEMASAQTPTSSSSSAAVALVEAERNGRGREVGGAIVVSSPSAPSSAAAAVSAATTSSSSSPGPRVSLRSSGGEYATTVRDGLWGSVNQVPRSFSDISCHHSRAGSDVSSEASRASRTSRASRASAGANLEKFFNEMGMERDILDPLIQLQRRQFGGSEQDIYESISSLDSHGDARSICSALSRSEREISDAESFERSQQQTSIVERNARIIKWLCSVKKAKTPAASIHHGSAAS